MKKIIPLLIGSAFGLASANAATVYSFDVDDATPTTQSGFTSIEGTDNTSVSISPLTFTVFGGVLNLDRGAISGEPMSDMLRDFAYKNTANGATALRIAGLAAGVYNVQSWHYDSSEQAGDAVNIEFRPQGGSATVLVANHVLSKSAATYQITADGTSTYELVFRENATNPGNRSRFNGITLTAVPEPSSAALLGLGGLALLARKKR